MTIDEAIEVLSDFDKQVSAKADGAYQSTIGEMACKVAINALEEIQKYREIGTPEECRAAVEKQKKVKPTIINNGIMLNFKCPRCGIERLVGRNAREDYCGECGQLWDWSDEE